MLVELSHVLNQTTPPYPGDPVYGCTPTLTISKDGCSVHHVSFGTHTGTHIDAPSHFIHDGKTVDQIPLESLLHRTVIIADFSGWSLQRDEIIQANHPILQKALAATITADTVLLLKTGWSRYWGTPEYNTWPSFSASAAQAILDAGIRLVGVDTFSPDAPEGDFDAHRIWLRSGVLIVENLDLSHLEGDGWSLSVVPLRLEGLDGSPIRAFAQRL